MRLESNFSAKITEDDFGFENEISQTAKAPKFSVSFLLSILSFSFMLGIFTCTAALNIVTWVLSMHSAVLPNGYLIFAYILLLTLLVLSLTFAIISIVLYSKNRTKKERHEKVAPVLDTSAIVLCIIFFILQTAIYIF